MREKRLEQRFVAAIIALIMLLVLIPMGVFAEDNNEFYSGGDGSVESPFCISTPDQLDSIRHNLSANYILTKDINLSGIDWNPIGSFDKPFSGTFNGNGHIISNLLLNEAITDEPLYSSARYSSNALIGLFGAVFSYEDNTVTIENVTLKNCTLKMPPLNNTDGYTYEAAGGLLAGYASDVNIRNCKVYEGKVEFQENDKVTDASLGGLIGEVFGTVENCYVSANINVSSNLLTVSVGGLFGDCYPGNYTALMSDCAIKVNGKSSVNCGGVSGASVRATMAELINMGDITVSNADFAFVGGLIGNFHGELIDGECIRDSYNYGLIDSLNIVRDNLNGRICGSVPFDGYDGYSRDEHGLYDNYSLKTATINGAVPTQYVEASQKNGASLSGKEMDEAIKPILDKIGIEKSDDNDDFPTNGDSKDNPSTNPIDSTSEDDDNPLIVTSYVRIDRDQLELSLLGGYESHQLQYTCYPTSDNNVKWTSSDKDVAIVNDEGFVQARGLGTCTISAARQSDGEADECVVIVKERGFNLSIDSWPVENSNAGFDYPLTYKIPLDIYQDVFGKKFTKSVYKQTVGAWNGNCFGMTVTALLNYEKAIDLSPYYLSGYSFLNTGGLSKYSYDGLIETAMLGISQPVIEKQSDLGKIIERYQAWDDSIYNQQLLDKAAAQRFGYDEDDLSVMFERVVNHLENKNQPLLVGVNWDDEKGKRHGHALIAYDCEKIWRAGSSFWYRIHLYDPNAPYYKKENGGKLPKSYAEPMSRYVDINSSTGEWEMSTSINSSSDSNDIGLMDGVVKKNSIITFNSYEDFPKKIDGTSIFTGLNKDEIRFGVEGDYVCIADKNGKKIYEYEKGVVKIRDNSVKLVASWEDNSADSFQKLLLPNGDYSINTRGNSIITAIADNKYFGIEANEPLTMDCSSNLDLVSLYSDEKTTVSIVAETIENDNHFNSIETELEIGKAENQFKLKDNTIVLHSSNASKAKALIIDEIGEREAELFPVDSIIDFTSNYLNGIVKGLDGKWALYKEGKIDTSFTGIAKNQYGWWRIEKGYVDFNAQGIYQNEYGWWKTTNGKVTFNETGIFQNEYGWWRVEKSKVNFKADGIYKNQYGWWKTTGGKVTFKENGVFKNEYGWWKVKDSKVDFSFTGIASNKYGKWYIKDGKVDFSKNGKVKYNGATYSIKNGKVQ